MTQHATKVVPACDKSGTYYRQLVAYIHNIPCYRTGQTLEAFSPPRKQERKREKIHACVQASHG